MFKVWVNHLPVQLKQLRRYSSPLKPNILQELEEYRLPGKFEPNIKISNHVTTILKGLEIPDDLIDVESTANSYGFYGNFWRPFKTIY